MTLDLDKLTELEANATPGPWRECGRDGGGCQCCVVWANSVDAPIAETTHGPWGDRYPAIRLAKDSSSIAGRYEAYIERIDYGEVPQAAGLANAKLIAEMRNALPELIALARKAIERE